MPLRPQLEFFFLKSSAPKAALRVEETKSCETSQRLGALLETETKAPRVLAIIKSVYGKLQQGHP